MTSDAPLFVTPNETVTAPPGGALDGAIDSVTAIGVYWTAADDGPAISSATAAQATNRDIAQNVQPVSRRFNARSRAPTPV